MLNWQSKKSLVFVCFCLIFSEECSNLSSHDLKLRMVRNGCGFISMAFLEYEIWISLTALMGSFLAIQFISMHYPSLKEILCVTLTIKSESYLKKKLIGTCA